MKHFKLAIATDDGKSLIKRHFGDADLYYIYDINNDAIKHLKTIKNNVDEEDEVHADPKKAKGIAQLLKKEGVEVVASKIFGPNIKRIIKKFACVIVKRDDMMETIELILQNKEEIKKELDKGENRNPLKLG